MALLGLRKLHLTISSVFRSVPRCLPRVATGSRNYAKTSESLRRDQAGEKLDVPLRFTGTKAQAWQARQTRLGGTDDILWYQPYVIVASLSTFMIYFFILREENDIDLIFDKSLYDHIEDLEEQQIEMTLEHNKQNGIDTKELEARLREIRGQ